MERRERMCDGCPFSPFRPPLDRSVRETIKRRIRGGELWICHQTCDGARELPTSLACAGAPEPGGTF